MATVPEIHAAADALAADGKKPTLAAVRAAAGGGSFTTISEAMKTWPGKARPPAGAPEAAPAAVAEAAARLAGELWGLAQQMAQARLETEREALGQARQDLEAERLEAVNLADQVSAELEAEQARGRGLAGELAQARADAERTADRLRQAQALAEHRQAQAGQAEAVLQECERRAALLADELARDRAALDRLSAQLEAERQARATAEQAAAVLAAKLEAADDRTARAEARAAEAGRQGPARLDGAAKELEALRAKPKKPKEKPKTGGELTGSKRVDAGSAEPTHPPHLAWLNEPE